MQDINKVFKKLQTIICQKNVSGIARNASCKIKNSNNPKHFYRIKESKCKFNDTDYILSD